MDEEFHITIRVKNNRLLARRRELGLTVYDVQEHCGISVSMLCAYECLRLSPVSRRGGWKSSALRLAAAYGMMPEELWPDVVLQVEKPVIEHVISAETLGALVSQSQERRLLPASTTIENRERLEHILKAAEKLPERQRLVFKRRYLEGATLHDISQEIGVGRERVRGIAARAEQLIRCAVPREFFDSKRTWSEFQRDVADAVKYEDGMYIRRRHPMRLCDVHRAVYRRDASQVSEEVTRRALHDLELEGVVARTEDEKWYYVKTR